MQLDIAEVCDGDLGVCAQIIRESFATVAREFGLTEQNCPTNGAFLREERLRSDKQRGVQMHMLRADGEAVGFFALEDKGEGEYELEKLAVLPSLRHNGLGTALLDCAKERARALGGVRLTIGIIEENAVLKSWYMRHGFVPTGTRVFPHLPFTVGFMRLDLADGFADALER